MDAEDDEVVATLSEIHRLTFSRARRCRHLNEEDIGGSPFGWLAFCETAAVAFAGLVPSSYAENAGYFAESACCQSIRAEHCNCA